MRFLLNLWFGRRSPPIRVQEAANEAVNEEDIALEETPGRGDADLDAWATSQPKEPLDEETLSTSFHDLPDGVFEAIGLSLHGRDKANFRALDKRLRDLLSHGVVSIRANCLDYAFLKSPLELKEHLKKVVSTFSHANRVHLHTDASVSNLPVGKRVTRRDAPLLNISAALEALSDAWRPPAGATQQPSSSTSASPDWSMLHLELDFRPELAPINLELDLDDELETPISLHWGRDIELFMTGLDRSLPLLNGRVKSLLVESCIPDVLPGAGIVALEPLELRLILPKAEPVPAIQLAFVSKLSGLQTLSLSLCLTPHPTALLSYALSNLTSLTRLELQHCSNKGNYMCSSPLIKGPTRLQALHLKFIETATYTEFCSLTSLTELFFTVGDERAEEVDGIVATASAAHLSSQTEMDVKDLNPLDLWSALGKLPALKRLSINSWKSSAHGGSQSVYDDEGLDEDDEEGMPLPARRGILRLPSSLPHSLHNLDTLGLLIGRPEDLRVLAPLTLLTQLVLCIDSYGSRGTHEEDDEDEEEEEEHEEEEEEGESGDKETSVRTLSDSMAFFSLLTPLTNLKSFRLFDSLCAFPVTNNGLRAFMSAQGREALTDLYLDGHVETNDWSPLKEGLKCLSVHHAHFTSPPCSMSFADLPKSLISLSLESVRVSSFEGPHLPNLQSLHLFWPLALHRGLSLYDAINSLENLHTLTLEIDLDSFMAAKEGPNAVCPHCHRRLKKHSTSEEEEEEEEEEEDHEEDSSDGHSSCTTDPSPMSLPSLTNESSLEEAEQQDEEDARRGGWLCSPFSHLAASTSLRTLTICFIEGSVDTENAIDQFFVDQVCQLTGLESLEIWTTYGSDWDPSVDLTCLSALTSLRSLSMESLPREPAKNLYAVMKQALPGCKLKIIVDNEPREDEDEDYSDEDEDDEDEETEDDEEDEDEDSDGSAGLIPELLPI